MAQDRAARPAIDASSPPAAVAAFAERVVFRLWAAGEADARSIEQARREIDDKTRLDQALVRLGLVDETAAAKALADELGAPYAGDGDFPACPIALELLPKKFVKESLALPIGDDGTTLRIAMADPLDGYAQRAIQLKTRRRLEIACAAPERLADAIERLYDPNAAAPTPAPKADPAPAPAFWPSAEPKPASTPPVETASPPAAVEPVAATPTPVAPPTPRFVRPKRVTLKNVAQPSTVDRPAPPESGAEAAAAAAVARFQAAMGRSPAPVAAPLSAETPSAETRSAETAKPSVAPARRPLDPAEVAARERRAEARAAAADQAARAAADAARAKPSASDARDARSKLGSRLGSRFDRAVDAALAAKADAAAPTVADAPSPARRAAPDGLIAAVGARAPRREGVRAAAPEGRMRRFTGAEAAVAAPKPDPAESVDLIARAAARQSLDAGPAARAASPAPSPAAAPSAPSVRAMAADAAGAAAMARSAARQAALSEVRKTLRAAVAVGAAVREGVAQADASAPPRKTSRADLLRAAARAAAGPAAADAARAASNAPPPVDARAAFDDPCDLTALGFSQAVRDVVDQAIAARDGLILICGPAGSGKVATLNAVRALLAEHGVETCDLAALDAGDAAAASRDARKGRRRAALGHIRGSDGAEAAARAAMTGWLTVVTLEAPSAAAAAPRLIRMGVPPYVLASSLRAAIAQHLAPRLDGGGAAARHVAIAEAFLVDDDARALILAQAPEPKFRSAMRAVGAPSLADDAAAKSAAGLVSKGDAARAAGASAPG